MNIATFERGQLAAFAYKAARKTGSLDCMKAICYVLRNRMKAGWGNGTWLSIIEGHVFVSGNMVECDPLQELDPQDRLLQLIVRDIDDLYLGTSEDDTKTVVQDALYYHFIDRDPRPWFVENIVRDPQTHPRIAQVGPIALFR